MTTSGASPSRGRWLRGLLVVVIIAGLGFAAGRMIPAGGQEANGQAAGAPKGPQATQVTVADVATNDFADSIEALGTTRANETVQLTAQISDKVQEIRFTDGQVVRQGDVLLVLDNAEELADLDAAKAMAAERKSAFERAEDLNKRKIIAEETFETRRAEYQQAEAEVRSLQSRIDNTIITAPFDGILGLRNVSLGALVQPGTVITTIDDLSVIKVDFEVPALYLQDLKAGLKVNGTVEGLPGRTFAGEVATVNTQVDPVTRAVRIRAIIPNPDLLLRPGLLMNVTLDLRARQSLTVPEAALIQLRDQTFVFVAEETEEGKTLARRVEIKRGMRRLGEVEVLGGLQEGQRVIVTGFMRLVDGDAVVINEKAITTTAEPSAPQSDMGAPPAKVEQTNAAEPAQNPAIKPAAGAAQ